MQLSLLDYQPEIAVVELPANSQSDDRSQVVMCVWRRFDGVWRYIGQAGFENCLELRPGDRALPHGFDPNLEIQPAPISNQEFWQLAGYKESSKDDENPHVVAWRQTRQQVYEDLRNRHLRLGDICARSLLRIVGARRGVGDLGVLIWIVRQCWKLNCYAHEVKRLADRIQQISNL